MDYDNMTVFYELGKTHLYSIAVMRNGEYRCQYDNETLSEIQAVKPNMRLMPFNDAWRAIDAAQTAAYCHAPVEISQDQFFEMLEVLLPCKWLRGTDSEAFFISEALCSDIHNWCVRIGSRYWSLNRSCTRSPESVISEVATAASVTP